MLEQGIGLPPDVQAGMLDLGEGDAAILSSRRHPQLLEHLFAVTAPRRG